MWKKLRGVREMNYNVDRTVNDWISQRGMYLKQLKIEKSIGKSIKMQYELYKLREKLNMYKYTK